MTQTIFICYSRCDENTLCFGVGFDYERDEYKLASRQEFTYDEEGIKLALEYGKSLAASNNMKLDVFGICDHNFLD